MFLDEAARTVNKLFHALCYDVSRNNVWSSSSHGGNGSESSSSSSSGSNEKESGNGIDGEQSVQEEKEKKEEKENKEKKENVVDTTQVGRLQNYAKRERRRTERVLQVGSANQDENIGPFESQEHRQRTEHFAELVGGRLETICQVQGRKSFSLPSLTYGDLRSPMMIRATHAARVLFRSNSNGTRQNSDNGNGGGGNGGGGGSSSSRASQQRRWLRKVTHGSVSNLKAKRERVQSRYMESTVD